MLVSSRFGPLTCSFRKNFVVQYGIQLFSVRSAPVLRFPGMFAALTAQQKIELAKRLHFDYNASEKQLQRLLKIDKKLTFSWDWTGTSLWQPAVLAGTVPVLTRNN